MITPIDTYRFAKSVLDTAAQQSIKWKDREKRKSFINETVYMLKRDILNEAVERKEISEKQHVLFLKWIDNRAKHITSKP
jgi:hypothetical protein